MSVGGITSLSPIRAHEIQIMVSEYQTSKRTGLLAEHPLLLMLVFSLWLQESWDIGGTQLYKWDHLDGHSIKYFKT